MKARLTNFAMLAVLAGCGSFGADPGLQERSTPARELLMIPNFAANSVTIKEINLRDGSSKVLEGALPSNGTHPVSVRSHPNLKVFYVVNRDSNVISQFSLDSSGTASMISTISCPGNTQLLLIHPSGGWAYAAGGTTLRTYAIASTGELSVLGADVVLSSSPGWDGDFAHNGDVLHLPETGQIQSFPVRFGILGAPQTTPLDSNADQAVDIDVRPQGSALEVCVQGHDSIRTYDLNSSGFLDNVNVQTLSFRPATGDFASNGQYYLGEDGSPGVHAYHSKSSSGLLSELPDSPLTLDGTGGAFFTALDLTERFVFSTDGNSNNRLDTRVRQPDGSLQGSLSDNQALDTPGLFDFLLFQVAP
jgi:6-phosphogluconolactonase (cycloisomerase 2 family)